MCEGVTLVHCNEYVLGNVTSVTTSEQTRVGTSSNKLVHYNYNEFSNCTHDIKLGRKRFEILK